MIHSRQLLGIAAATLIGALALGSASAAQEIRKHSGTIVDVHEGKGTFVLAEIGPWTVRDGATVISRRTIALAPETTFTMVRRQANAPSGFPGDFVETPLDISQVYVSDYVTVECRRESNRLVAVKITVVALPEPSAGRPG